MAASRRGASLDIANTLLEMVQTPAQRAGSCEEAVRTFMCFIPKVGHSSQAADPFVSCMLHKREIKREGGREQTSYSHLG